jgi:hypothetical protein
LRLVSDQRLLSIHLGDPATLQALFKSERWRGRDNLRVTLHGDISARDLPSVLIPLLGVGLGGTALIGLLVSPWWGLRSLRWSAVALALFFALAALRAFRMALRGGLGGPLMWFQALLVAATYDAGRAAALVARSSHHRRAASTGAV